MSPKCLLYFLEIICIFDLNSGQLCLVMQYTDIHVTVFGVDCMARLSNTIYTSLLPSSYVVTRSLRTSHLVLEQRNMLCTEAGP